VALVTLIGLPALAVAQDGDPTGTPIFASDEKTAEEDQSSPSLNQPDRQATDSGGVKDSEQIIDIDKITQAVQKSTEPLYRSLEDTRLKERFEKVKKLLASGKVERDELLEALKDLRGGIDSFTDKWESIVDPLWAGQDALAEAIDKIRSKVPADGDGELPEKITKLLDTYDERLTDLATKIKATEDETRKKRLTKIFQNVLSLRRFTERLGRSGIHKVKARLMLRTVQILSRLQDQLMDATFELEKVRSILSSESDFINDYVELLQMARTAGDLLDMLREMRQSGQGLGGVPSKVVEVRKNASEITEGLTEASTDVLDELEAEIDQMGEDMKADLDEEQFDADVDLDAEIEKYSVGATEETHPIFLTDRSSGK
jgi:uncharacterized damage-inducible protein DinB